MKTTSRKGKASRALTSTSSGHYWLCAQAAAWCGRAGSAEPEWIVAVPLVPVGSPPPLVSRSYSFGPVLPPWSLRQTPDNVGYVRQARVKHGILNEEECL